MGRDIELVNTLINAGDTKKGQISIGNNVFFGHDVMLIARGHDYTKFGKARKKAIIEKPIAIGNGVWIGSRAIILGGANIGQNCVIAAGSVVGRPIPQNTIWGGIPARLIKKIPKKK